MMNLMAHVGKRPSILQLVNRLSDLFFKLCRQESHQKGLSEKRWRRFRPINLVAKVSGYYRFAESHAEKRVKIFSIKPSPYLGCLDCSGSYGNKSSNPAPSLDS